MELSDKVINILESHEIYIPNLNTLKDVDYVEMEFCSPAGEDFVFSVSIDRNDLDRSFVKGFCDYALAFDPDEHAELWIPCRGKNGVPERIRAILDDADCIAAVLNDTAADLKKETL